MFTISRRGMDMINRRKGALLLSWRQRRSHLAGWNRVRYYIICLRQVVRCCLGQNLDIHRSARFSPQYIRQMLRENVREKDLFPAGFPVRFPVRNRDGKGIPSRSKLWKYFPSRPVNFLISRSRPVAIIVGGNDSRPVPFYWRATGFPSRDPVTSPEI